MKYTNVEMCIEAVKEAEAAEGLRKASLADAQAKHDAARDKFDASQSADDAAALQTAVLFTESAQRAVVAAQAAVSKARDALADAERQAAEETRQSALAADRARADLDAHRLMAEPAARSIAVAFLAMRDAMAILQAERREANQALRRYRAAGGTDPIRELDGTFEAGVLLDELHKRGFDVADIDSLRKAFGSDGTGTLPPGAIRAIFSKLVEATAYGLNAKQRLELVAAIDLWRTVRDISEALQKQRADAPAKSSSAVS